MCVCTCMYVCVCVCVSMNSQEAGRAGRRGLDKVGTVVIAAWNNLPEPQQIKTLLQGKATNLSSQFRLRYNMILNLIRMNNLTVEDMMKRSFTEFYTQRLLTKQDFGTKLAEYTNLLDFLKVQQIQLDIQTHTDAPLSSFSQDASEIYSAEIDRLVDSFDDCQQVLDALLDFVPSKRRTKEFYDRLFTAGRLVCVQTDRVGCPCLAMIMRSPFDSFLHQQQQQQQQQAKVVVVAKSDSDIMREQLQSLQGSKQSSQKPQEQQQQQQQLLQDMQLWLMIYTPPEPIEAPFNAHAFDDDAAIDMSKPFREVSRGLDMASGRILDNPALGYYYHYYYYYYYYYYYCCYYYRYNCCYYIPAYIHIYL